MVYRDSNLWNWLERTFGSEEIAWKLEVKETRGENEGCHSTKNEHIKS